MRIALASFAGALAIAALCMLSSGAVAQPDDEATAWNAVKDSQSSLELRGFARAFPRGKYFDAALHRYIELARGTLPAETLDIQVNYSRDALALPFSVGSRKVELDVIVEANGRPGTIRITKRSGFDPIDRAAVGAARRAVYLPAVENGVAVSAHLPVNIDFVLQCPGEFSLVSCKDGEFR